ncbi:MAG: translocation/assembly module TamB, partial [Desulfatitalea sp.]|nr:translocation/assembly module TamB [Desulfatitalea sp.]NNK01395.1 translocation/assembly module TamB [Desulfatitalea sp.]
AQLGRFIHARLPAGRATAQIQLKGPLPFPELDLRIAAKDVALAPWTFGDITLQANLGSDGVVALTGLSLQNGQGRVNASGRIHLLSAQGHLNADPALGLQVDFEQLDADAFSDQLPVDLRLSGRLTLSGSVKGPRGDLTLLPSRIGWRDMTLDARAEAAWRDGRLNIAHLRLEKDNSAVALSGEITLAQAATGQWRSDPLVRAELTEGYIHLEDFAPQAEGRLEIKADVQGPLSALNGAFQIQGQTLQLPEQSIHALQLAGRLDAGTIRADRLAVALTPQDQISGTAWYSPTDSAFEVMLSADALEMARVTFFQRAYPTSGRMHLSIAARGDVRQPKVVLNLETEQMHIDGHPWKDIRLNAHLDGRHLLVDADLNLTLQGQCRLDEGSFEVAARFDQTDLSPYLALVADAQWQGRLSGQLNATGNWRDWKRIRGQAVLRHGRLAYQGVAVLAFDALQAELAHGLLDLPQTRLALLDQGFLEVAAKGDLNGHIAVTLNGRYPLAAADPFTDRINEAKGNILVAVTGSGPMDRIAWQGKVILSDIGCRIPELGQTLRGLEGTLYLDPQQVRIEGVTGRLDDGRFNLHGQMALQEMRPARFDLAFKAQALPLQKPNTMDMKLGADLSLKGDAQSARLEGDLVLLEGAYYENVRFNLLSLVTERQRAAPVPPTRQPPPWLKAVTLNITVTHRYPMLVYNNIARLEITPDLKISGTAAHPVISGRADATSGEVYFRQKTFTLKRGVVDFVNPYKIEPLLDIAAEAQIRQWLVTLTISGTPDDLLITLSSDPPESDADILSLILLGRTGQEIAENSGGGGATTRQMLAGLVAATWGEDLKKTTGLDILEVETGAGNNGQSDDRIQMTVGKKLNPRLTVKYSLESQKEQLVHSAISEYRLLEHFSASGIQDTEGNYGGELMFRIEFR